MSAAWKNLERRVCRALGGERAGPTGDTSDCRGVPFAVECKRSGRLGPPVLSAWIQQARRHAKVEGRPWLVVVAGHHDRRPVAALDFGVLLEILREAGRIPADTPEEVVDDDVAAAR